MLWNEAHIPWLTCRSTLCPLCLIDWWLIDQSLVDWLVRVWLLVLAGQQTVHRLGTHTSQRPSRKRLLLWTDISSTSQTYSEVCGKKNVWNFSDRFDRHRLEPWQVRSPAAHISFLAVKLRANDATNIVWRLGHEQSCVHRTSCARTRRVKLTMLPVTTFAPKRPFYRGTVFLFISSTSVGLVLSVVYIERLISVNRSF